MRKDILDPEITPYAKCPNCQGFITPDFSDLFNEDETINFKVLSERFQKCPHCSIELDFEREILPGFIEYSVISKAISSGNSLLSIDLALIVLLIFAILQFFNGVVMLSSFLGLLPLFVVLGWFFKYGKLQTDDEEYRETKKKLRLSLFLWLALNLLNLIVIIFIMLK